MIGILSSAAPPDAVVFDLDGTLIDSARDIKQALDQVLDEDGHDPLALPLVTAFIGLGIAKLVERAYRRLDATLPPRHLEAKVARFAAVYAANGVVHTCPFPGVRTGLRDLARAGIGLGVCTNKPTAHAEQILRTLGLLPLLPAIVGGDGAAARKPAAEPLLACLELLRARGERTLYIGDSETDVRTARAAGLPVMLVTYGYTTTPPAELAADGLIDRLDRFANGILLRDRILPVS